MQIITPHVLPKNEVKVRIEELIESLKGTFNNQIDEEVSVWKADTFEFSFKVGINKFSGSVIVNDADVIVNLDVPLLLKLFEKRIKDEIEKKLVKL